MVLLEEDVVDTFLQGHLNQECPVEVGHYPWEWVVLREVAAEEVVEITVFAAEAGEILVEEIIVPVIIFVDAVA